MSSSAKSPAFANTDVKAYHTFQGMDRSLDREGLETGKKQPLWSLRNGFCNWRGAIQRDPIFRKLKNVEPRPISALKFYNRDGVVFAENTGGYTTLNSDRGHRLTDAYANNSTVSFTVFQGKLMAFSSGQPMYRYDGFRWTTNNVSTKPAFGVPIQNRLAVAGMPSAPFEVLLSRVEDETIFPDEENPDSTEAIKAAFIDISNLIGTADRVIGLGVFEVNRLAIFTQDQTLVYKIDPDFQAWQLDNSANVRIGCISHNTIQNVGSDLFFCSRYGVHSLRRSEVNGLTVSSQTMSIRIKRLYERLVRETPDLSKVSACYDQDTGQYHVFIPSPNGGTRRLTLYMEAGYENITWSEGDGLNATCGDNLGGRLAFGTPGGIYEASERTGSLAPTFYEGNLYRPPLVFETPTLWQEDSSHTKNGRAIMLQAQGAGELIIHAYNEQGDYLTSKSVYIEDVPEDDVFPGTPLKEQYEVPFMYRWRGLQLRFETGGDSTEDIQVISFAIEFFTPGKD